MDLEVREDRLENINIEFSEEAKQRAKILAAFSLIQELYDEGKISKSEIKYIQEKYNINIA